VKKWFFNKLGVFATVEDALNSIESEEEKHKILTQAVANLYNTITEDDIFRKDGASYTYKGKPLMDAQVRSMRNQAEGFRESELFKMLDLELKHQANQIMFIKSKNEMDMVSGKLVLFTWNVIKSKINNI